MMYKLPENYIIEFFLGQTAAFSITGVVESGGLKLFGVSIVTVRLSRCVI